jgi:hypothetical protein
VSEPSLPFAAIVALVRHFEPDERKHFEAMQDDGEDTSRHIYNSIKEVSDWLGGRPAETENF